MPQKTLKRNKDRRKADDREDGHRKRKRAFERKLKFGRPKNHNLQGTQTRSRNNDISGAGADTAQIPANHADSVEIICRLE